MKKVRESRGVAGRSLLAVLPVAVTAAALAQQLTITKTADSPTPVSAGTPIGFTISVANTAVTGTVQDVTLSDPLPGGNDISWSLDATPTGCSLTGPPGS